MASDLQHLCKYSEECEAGWTWADDVPGEYFAYEPPIPGRTYWLTTLPDIQADPGWEQLQPPPTVPAFTDLPGCRAVAEELREWMVTVGSKIGWIGSRAPLVPKRYPDLTDAQWEHAKSRLVSAHVDDEPPVVTTHELMLPILEEFPIGVARLPNGLKWYGPPFREADEIDVLAFLDDVLAWTSSANATRSADFVLPMTDAASEPPKGWSWLSQVARDLRLSKKKVMQLCDDGTFETVYVGHKRYANPQDVRKYCGTLGIVAYETTDSVSAE